MSDFSRRSSDGARLERYVRTRWVAAGVAITLAAAGFLPASASLDTGERPVFVPITPCRLVDTRPAPETVGQRATALGANDVHAVQARGQNGNCLIPNDAVGVVMNVAAIGPTGDSYLTVFPSDAAKPLAANLNWVAGQPPVSNAVTADLSADGRVSFYNLAGTVNIAADIVGYFVDHTHDDRYYTKAQIDAAVAAAIDPAELAAATAAKADKPVGVQTLTLDPSAFASTTSGQSYDTGGGALDAEGLSVFKVEAPVQLPHGATVTGVSAQVRDSDATNGIWFALFRNPIGSAGLSDMAITPATVGTPGFVTLTDTTINFPTINNVANSYLLHVESISNLSILFSVSITYTLP